MIIRWPAANARVRPRGPLTGRVPRPRRVRRCRGRQAAPPRCRPPDSSASAGTGHRCTPSPARRATGAAGGSAAHFSDCLVVATFYNHLDGGRGHVAPRSQDRAESADAEPGRSGDGHDRARELDDPHARTGKRRKEILHAGRRYAPHEERRQSQRPARRLGPGAVQGPILIGGEGRRPSDQIADRTQGRDLPADGQGECGVVLRLRRLHRLHEAIAESVQPRAPRPRRGACPG